MRTQAIGGPGTSFLTSGKITLRDFGLTQKHWTENFREIASGKFSNKVTSWTENILYI